MTTKTLRKIGGNKRRVQPKDVFTLNQMNLIRILFHFEFVLNSSENQNIFVNTKRKYYAV